MIRFNCDYLEGAHPRVMERLIQTNMEQTVGYGEDEYCTLAKEKIREACKCPDADVHFLVGGTQTNTTVIAAALRPHQGVLSADSGHIACHETGAIESTGHSVLRLPAANGKITAEQIRKAVRTHRGDANREHMVQPKMVYLSTPTELGSIYTRAELKIISDACHDLGLYLYLDGARLAYGFGCVENDLDLPFLASCCDAFYIGGTKVGLLFGEAVVILNDAIKEDFRYLIKQRGGMLAKGRLLGIQFLTVFEDDLYFEMGRHAIAMAMQLKEGLQKLQIPFYSESPTNQQFVILPNETVERLRENYSFEVQEKLDDGRTAVRFCTSWATTEGQITALLGDLRGWE